MRNIIQICAMVILVSVASCVRYVTAKDEESWRHYTVECQDREAKLQQQLDEALKHIEELKQCP